MKLLLVFAAVSLIVPFESFGVPIPLGNLLGPGATLKAGELVFSQFDYRTTGPDMPNAMQVMVDTSVNGRNIGISFVALWEDTIDEGAQQDARIFFNVQSQKSFIDRADLFVFPIAVLPGQAGGGSANVRIVADCSGRKCSHVECLRF